MAIGDDSPRDHHPEEKSAEGTASSDGPIETAEWDLKVEARARRKIDSSVLLLLFLGLLVFQLDRMNLASALTGGFATDIKVSQDAINLGNQLMFMGIVVLEIPCNMALQRLGPRKWISGQVFVFGLVATLQLLLKNRTGFLVSRLVLGLAEAGYIPGAIYTLSTWYTKGSWRSEWQFSFSLDGSRGLRGWQWLFLLEGLFTICVSFLLLLFLPGSPDIPKPLIGRGLVKFSSEDKKVLQSRLEADDLGKRPGAQGLLIDWKLVWSTVSHYRRWPHYVSTFAVFSTWSPLTTYTPSIIMSLGFERITANALASVGAFIALLVVFAFAYISDRTGYRGGSVILAHVCYLIVLITARQAHPHVGKWSRWGLWTAVNSFAVGYHPVHNTWVQLNCVDAGERSIAIAMWVMSAISGLMVGTQYFRANDTPFYQTGLRTMIIMVSVGMAFAIIQVLVYRIHNKRLAKRGAQEQGRSVQLYTI
uniref:Major facilitator superfamily (MFS) profile domain-containing protein n=1 Tax=Bionectria ochroleuca TaxID=29856 RepID=A0A8H7NJ78_BIOOC